MGRIRLFHREKHTDVHLGNGTGTDQSVNWTFWVNQCNQTNALALTDKRPPTRVSSPLNELWKKYGGYCRAISTKKKRKVCRCPGEVVCPSPCANIKKQGVHDSNSRKPRSELSIRWGFHLANFLDRAQECGAASTFSSLRARCFSREPLQVNVSQPPSLCNTPPLRSQY